MPSLICCCNIWIVGSEFGVNNMKSILPCISGSCSWWHNGVGDIFLAHFLRTLLNIVLMSQPTWQLLLTSPLWPQYNHLVMAASSTMMHCHQHQIKTVKSQFDLNGMWRNRIFVSWMCRDKSGESVGCYHITMSSISRPLLVYAIRN